MKKYLLLLFMLIALLGTGQNFDGKFIDPKADSLLLIIEPDPVVVLDTFLQGNDHHDKTSYRGVLKMTTKVVGVFQFGSGQYYTVYNDDDGKLRRRFLGWRTGSFYLGNTVFRDSRDTRRWIIVFDEHGLPGREMLPDWLQPK